nr:hypothetical protein [Bifidobacterium callimiconis]
MKNVSGMVDDRVETPVFPLDAGFLFVAFAAFEVLPTLPVPLTVLAPFPPRGVDVTPGLFIAMKIPAAFDEECGGHAPDVNTGQIVYSDMMPVDVTSVKGIAQAAMYFLQALKAL